MPAFAAPDNVSNLVQTIDWTKPTWDLFIILFFVLAALLYGMSMGKDRTLSSVIAIYIALAVVKSAPETINIPNMPAIQISAFIGIIIIIMFLLSRSALQRALTSSEERGPLIHMVIFSILHIGLVVSVILSLLPQVAIEKLSPITRAVFIDHGIGFAWIVAPILAMLALAGAKKPRRYKYDI